MGVGVEQHHPARRLGGEPVEEIGDQVAFRVDHHDTAAGVGVGEDQLRHERRLPRSGRSEQVQVMAGVGYGKADRAAGSGVGNPERLDPLPGSVRGGDARWRGHGTGTGLL